MHDHICHHTSVITFLTRLHTSINSLFISQYWQLFQKLLDINTCLFYICYFHVWLFYLSFFHIYLFIFIYFTHSIMLMLIQLYLHDQIFFSISFLNVKLLCHLIALSYQDTTCYFFAPICNICLVDGINKVDDRANL